MITEDAKKNRIILSQEESEQVLSPLLKALKEAEEARLNHLRAGRDVGDGVPARGVRSSPDVEIGHDHVDTGQHLARGGIGDDARDGARTEHHATGRAGCSHHVRAWHEQQRAQSYEE